MTCTVVVGGFFGDEGKGKIIAYIAKKDNVTIAARGGVGPNAGHTFAFEDKTYKVRMLPSAILNPNTQLMVGAGVLVNPQVLKNEIESFNTIGRTFVDYNCAIITQEHIDKDLSNDHLKSKVGTTGTGTGPANADRVMRIASLARDTKELSPYVVDVSEKLNDAIDKNKNVLLEGTQGTYLSLYHGGYPYVTSKDVTASAICSDVGIGPKKVDEVLVVFKSYVTRVGGGPLDGELDKEEAKKRGWLEFGSVTGRERRSAPFNFELARKSIRLNSGTQLAITKLDVLFPDCSGKNNFNSLSLEAKEFIGNIESQTNLPVVYIGTGRDLNSIIDRRSN